MRSKWVNAQTGEPVSNKAKAEHQGIEVITKQTYQRNRLVNAQTGEPVSNKEEAEQQGIEVITKRTYQDRNRLVNAQTGEPVSNKEEAEQQGIEVITKQTYQRNQWVNAQTGEPVSNKEEAVQQGIEVITKNNYQQRNRLVNAKTGEPVSNKEEAEQQGIEVIIKQTYQQRNRLVNAQTGELVSNKAKAEQQGIKVITKNNYQLRNQWVNAQTGEPVSNRAEAMQRGIDVMTNRTYQRNRWVNAQTGEPVSNRAEAMQRGIKVITKRTYQERNRWVKAKAGESVSNKAKAVQQDIEVITNDADLHLTKPPIFPSVLPPPIPEMNYAPAAEIEPHSPEIHSQLPPTRENKRGSEFFELPPTKFIKQEKSISIPLCPLTFEELHQAILILRGCSSAEQNCVHLARDMLQFISSRKMPSQPSIETPATLDYFKTSLETSIRSIPLKTEDGQPTKKRAVTQVTQSSVYRNTDFFNKIAIPYQEQAYPVSENTMDLTKPPIIDLENYQQLKMSYHIVHKHLKEMAEKAENQEYYGAINFGFSGKASLQGGHMIVFYAKPEQVYFIDGQFVNSGVEEKPAVFENLTTHYRFADTALLTKEKEAPFSCEVFILPVLKNNSPENAPSQGYVTARHNALLVGNS